MEVCYYCGQEGKEMDRLNRSCCADCWEHMKDWTLEKQADFEKLHKETMAIVEEYHKRLYEKHGMPPETTGIVICHYCEQIVKCREDGSYYCDCTDERRGADNPWAVPLPERLMKPFEE